MNRHPLILPAWALVALALGNAGCGRSLPARAVEEPTHERPAHHPGSLVAALPAIRARAAHLTATPADAATATAELRDILRWIPQLAADTTLGRSAWEEVTGIATAAGDRLATAAGTDREGLAEELEAVVARLERIVTVLADDPTSGESSP